MVQLQQYADMTYLYCQHQRTKAPVTPKRGNATSELLYGSLQFRMQRRPLDVARSAFDVCHVSAVHVGPLTQFFLRDVKLMAARPQNRAQSGLKLRIRGQGMQPFCSFDFV